MKIPPVRPPEDEEPVETPQNQESDLAIFFRMFINENRRMDTRMLALENKFDKLLETLDLRMAQLITALIEKPDKPMVPVDVFTKLLFATLLAIFVAMYGADVVIAIVAAFKSWYLNK